MLDAAVVAPVSPLFRLALAKGTESSVVLHLRRGAGLNSRDASGRTPLMIAAALGRMDICVLLLVEGADPQLQDANGLTASDIAARAGHHEVGRHLLQASVAPAQVMPADQGDDGIDAGLEGWEPEQDFRPPDPRQAPDEGVLSLQEAISAHRVTVEEDDWSAAEISLPQASSLRAPVLPEEAGIILAHAVANGWISARGLHQIWPGATSDQRRMLRAAVEEAGLRIVPVRIAATLLGRGATVPGRADRELAGEIICGLGDELGSDRTGERYLAEIASFSTFSPDREQRIFARLAEARQAALEAAEECRGLLAGLEVQQTTEGRLDESVDSEEAGSDEDNSSDEAGVSEADAVSAGLPFEALHKALERAGSCRDDPSLAVLAKALRQYETARNRAMEGAMKLVPWIAGKYRRSGLPFEDLVQEGNIGLIRAVEKFDLSKGVRFGAYASYWIRQSISRAVDDHSRGIRIPVHVSVVLRKFARLQQRIRAVFNREPTVEEIAAALEKPVGFAKRLLQLPVAGSWRVPEDVADEGPAPDHRYDAACLHRLIAGSISELPARSERILRLRFGLGGVDEHTLEEAGDLYDVTRERIRQIEAKAIKFLQHPNRSKDLQAFL
ncbi:MAG: sigma-70 family RNA polymerase sigma factor [Mesorhizobium sp.]|uniref:sigma-70 family RNA polymerase sigma factor n=1 Tax=Mesorhizobium sp. TaxID=1871066 RepID=UPI0011FA17E1|nr:sigma-70 family RNA polymerase sigma factor [Mesorhizobium sp.]TIQ33094.1 MAG: sigma-70 family RNA polymerase sigma factor [Mesorhizobium sp.]